MAALTSKRILIISTNYGTETDEIGKPLEYLKEQGADVIVAAPQASPIQTLRGDREPGPTVSPDITLAEARPEDYDAVIIPGGTINADGLRVDENAQRIVSGVAGAGKVVAAICHAPWLLINAGIASGKTLTSYPTLRTDLTNAGAMWVDQDAKVCPANGYRLITSRTPDDLPAFNRAILEALG